MANERGAGTEANTRILVVDDDPQLRRLLGTLLGSRWTVELAEDGEAAWNAVGRALPDLVISDVHMPMGGGLALLRRLRSEPTTVSVPVILVSGHPDETVAGLEAGADDFLSKPFSSRELLVRVQSRLEITAMRRRAAVQEATVQSLQRHTRWIEELLDTLPVPLVLLEPETARIVFANRAVARLAGTPLPRGSKLTVAGEFSGPEDEGGHHIEASELASASAPNTKVRDRRVVWHTAACSVSLIADSVVLGALDGQGPVVLLTLRDVTSLVEEQAALRRTVQIRDEFLSVASHELRTPITTLSLNTESLLTSHARNGSGERTQRRLDSIRRQVSRLQQLVDFLLDASRLVEGHLELQAEPVDMGAVASESIDLLHEPAVRAGCRISMHAEQNVVGQWDKLRVGQVITNLLSNAIKFGGGGAVDVEITRSGRMARLRVRDHGIGISPEGCARIFYRFERASSAGHFPGLGLGLWITKQIVDAYHGAISVESQPGEGSTFTVELPCAPSSPP